MAAIIGLFAGTVILLTFGASTPYGERFGLPQIDSALLGTIPNLMIIYWAMLFYLFYFVPRGVTKPVEGDIR